MMETKKPIIYTSADSVFQIAAHEEIFPLEEFDARIPEIIEAMNDKDILIINEDHGNDPAYKGTDHTREYIPLLVYGKDIKPNINLGTRKSFADIGATVADILGVCETKNGTSFKNEVMK